MQALSRRIEREHHLDLAGPCAGLCVALGGAVLVVGGLLLVGARELSVARYIPDFSVLQSLIVG